MPIYLIKNNLKLMLRNKWMIFVMIAGPIIIISVLSSAFEDLMKSYEGSDEFLVGYYIEEESMFYHFIDDIKVIGGEMGILFSEYTSETINFDNLPSNIASFVDFTKDGYLLYKVEGFEIEGMTLEYFINQVVMSNISSPLPLTSTELEFMPDIKSIDYYGIIEIVYFIFCCFVSLTCVLSDEKKYGIGKRIQVTPISDFAAYIAKVIPCILATICEMAITIFLVTFLYDIKWGNIPYTILILGLSIVAATAFGLFLLYLFDNLAFTIITAFSIIWVAGFLGGSFETYMFSSFSESTKRLSPLYHVNRTLVEYSCMGKSNYTVSCILYLLILTVLCTVMGLGVVKLRKGKLS